MSKIARNLEFPTDTRGALESLRRRADVSDRADGVDHVDEEKDITTNLAKGIWQRAVPPNAQDFLALGASGQRAAERSRVSPSSAIFLSARTTDRKLSWQDIAAAFKAAEKNEPLNETNITQALVGLGFARDVRHEQNAGCMLFTRGKRTVGIRVFQLGAIRAAELAVAKKSKRKKGAAAFDASKLQPGSLGTYVAGTLVEPHHWRRIVDEFTQTLELARDALVLAGDGKRAPSLPLEFSALKKFIANAKSKKGRLQKAAENAEIRARQEKITSLWTTMLGEGSAPKSVMLQLGGPDGAGKTSSSKYLPKALLAANPSLPRGKRFELRTEGFTKPTEQDKTWQRNGVAEKRGLAAWLSRHVMRGMPKRREILIKDRFIGDYIYEGENTPKRLEEMASDFARYEQLAKSRGVLCFKAILWADQDKQAKTFGKRMGRGAFADALIAELSARGQLTEKIEADLLDVRGKIEAADLVALNNFGPILERYKAFGTAIGAPVIDATNRHSARLQLLDMFYESLVNYRAAWQATDSTIHPQST